MPDTWYSKIAVRWYIQVIGFCYICRFRLCMPSAFSIYFSLHYLWNYLFKIRLLSKVLFEFVDKCKLKFLVNGLVCPTLINLLRSFVVTMVTKYHNYIWLHFWVSKIYVENTHNITECTQKLAHPYSKCTLTLIRAHGPCSHIAFHNKRL